MYLIFDSSALGNPKNWKAPYHDGSNWPRMIHLSWILLGEDFKPKKDFNCLIKPDGFEIEESVAERSGIDVSKAKEKGDDLKEVLQHFSDTVNEASFLFAHNLNFNENIVAAEFYRSGVDHKIFEKERFCLMQESTYYCRLKGKGGKYKWPSLQELHTILFKQKYTPAQNARADVIAAARCFIMLMKKGELEDLF